MAAIAELMDLTTLDRVECLRLLAEGGIGRIVCTDGALPTAEPVSYVLDHEEIIFRAEVGGRLATSARNAVVAFQADDFEEATGTGWSVLGGRSGLRGVGCPAAGRAQQSRQPRWPPGSPVTDHRGAALAIDRPAVAGERSAPGERRIGLRRAVRTARVGGWPRFPEVVGGWLRVYGPDDARRPGPRRRSRVLRRNFSAAGRCRSTADRSECALCPGSGGN